MWKDLKSWARRNAGRIVRDRSSLSTFLFHAVYRDEAEIRDAPLAPQQDITVERFRAFVRHYVEAGYRFVSPRDLDEGLDDRGRYVMATFDDGYFNNRLVLPVLREFEIPALFFVVTGNVREQKAFWWDVLHRESQRRNLSENERRRRSQEFKKMSPAAIEAALTAEFGPDVMTPVGDVDRPFDPSELASFAAEPFVHIGNHTSDHGILDNFDESENEVRIAAAQESLEEMCGHRPSIIAYPNGNYDDGAIRAAMRQGLNWGITVDKRKNYLPLPSEASAMRLGRFVLWGQRDIDQQCEIFRSDFTWTGMRASRSVSS